MTKIKRWVQEIFQKTTISNHVQMLRERFLALLLIGLLPFLFYCEGTSIIRHETSLSLIAPACETNS